MLLDLSSDTLLLELVLPNIASVSQAGRVEDTDLRKRLHGLTTLRNIGTYHHAVVAPKFVQANRNGPRLITQTTALVGAVEGFEVVVINILAGKDIGDELQG